MIGSSNGSVRFYDFQYRIRSWFEDIDVGSITNISFSNETLQEGDSIRLNKEDEDLDDNDKPFVCPDFIVVDHDAKVTLLKASLFEEIEKNKKGGTLIMSSIVSPIVSISVRPNSSVLALSCENGRIYEWNFYEKNNELTELVDPDRTNVPVCIDFCPDGRFLSVCTRVGSIHMYEVKEKRWQKNFLLVSETEKAKPKISF